ncbi:hypothetical protein AMTRI_Chr12g270910 [Amborella trichopoda]
MEMFIFRLFAKSLRNLALLDVVDMCINRQLFGGNTLKLSSGANFHGEINILLVGDPDTRIYSSGRGSSAVVLTAYVSKEPETRETAFAVLTSWLRYLIAQEACCMRSSSGLGDQGSLIVVTCNNFIISFSLLIFFNDVHCL